MLLLGYKITSKNKNTTMTTTRMRPTQTGVLKSCFTIPSTEAHDEALTSQNWQAGIQGRRHLRTAVSS